MNAELYDRLVAERREARLLHRSDPAIAASCGALLFHEARLLDERRYEDWLELFARECVYWVPMDDEADPRSCISIIFDDRRRLEDRILRLRGGFALNQVPEPRLLHQIGNVEAWSMPDGRLRVMSTQSVHERRAGRHQLTYRGRVEHVLIQEEGQWRIQKKHVLLLNRDDGLETPPLL